jgi:DNA-binding FadR family transcriptional regulator
VTEANDGLRPAEGKLSKRVAAALQELILNGEWGPGSLLPNEAELGQTFGVSRTVIREAVRTLEAQGLVHVRRGIGTQTTAGGKSAYIAALFLVLRRSGCTMHDLFSFRRLVEPEFAAEAARQATGRDLSKLREALEAYAAASAAGNHIQIEEKHLHFHQAILQTTHNPVVQALIDPLAEMLLLSYVPRGSGILPTLPSKELLDIEAHRELLACIEKGDSMGARRAMLTDFNNARTDYDSSVPIGAWETEHDDEKESEK